MPGIIPFFHLEDPDSIRERLDLKMQRKRTRSSLLKAVRSETLEAHQLEPPVLPGQIEFSFTNKL